MTPVPGRGVLGDVGPGVLGHAGSPALSALTVAALLLTGGLYAAGWSRRDGRWAAPAAALAGVALLVALVGPVDRLADERFSVHMVQHLLLTAVAAPALVVARPNRVLARVLSPGARRAIGRTERRLSVLRPRRRWFTWQVGAAVVHSAVLWAWHLPVLYEAALGSTAVHVVEHVTMLGSAVVLWGVVVAGARAGVPTGAAALFLTSILGMALAAMLTFADAPLYAPYATAASGPTAALADQQVAGGLMWVPGKVLPLAAAAAVVVHWLARSERGRPLAQPVR